MAHTLDTLSELIDRHLPALDMNREELAKTLGVSPSTLSRWSNRMPGAQTVRALAAVLDQPYGVVLAAALRSGGYAETTADILTGHSLTLVARDPTCSQAGERNNEPGAVFTDPDRASQWAHVRGQLDARRAGYGHGNTAAGTVVIDHATTPNHVVVYRASWDHRTDTVSVTEAGVFAEVPSGLDPQTARVESLSDTGKVFAVSASGMDADFARLTVEAAVSRLRQQGRLLGTEDSTGLSFSDHLLHGQRMTTHDYVQSSEGEELRVESAERARIEALVSKFSHVPHMPYVWGGGTTSSVEPQPGDDPITSYRMRPPDGDGLT